MRSGSLSRSVDMIPDGASLMTGGFMAVGTPERVIDEVVRQRKCGLTVIANDAAMPGKGALQAHRGQAGAKVIASHIDLNPQAKQMMAHELDVELVPQGTLIERTRAGGYGLGSILTQTGVGTSAEQGKQRIRVDRKDYVVEVALRADFALVQAFIADYLGNLSYALTAHNFNPLAPKIVRQCTLPITSRRPVDLVVTEMAVIAFPKGRATLLETAPGTTPDQVVAATQAELVAPRDVAEMPA